MVKPQALRSPEDILKEIERKKAEAEKAASEAVMLQEELKAAKIESAQKAIQKLGADFEEKFKAYVGKRRIVADRVNKIESLKKEIQEAELYLRDQHKVMRDSLVGAGVKEAYLSDIIGEPPAEKKATTSTGERRKKSKVRTPTGEVLSWVEFGMKQGVPEAELRGEGINARRVLDAKGVKLPEGYSIVEVD